jgi:para-nitrobenzyl esterase
VPILEGSNHDEYRLFARLDEITPPDGKILMTQDDYAAAIASVFGTTTDGMPSATSLAILQAYPLTAYDNNPTLAFATAGTDQIFACNSRATGAALSASTTSKVFVYEFNDQNAPELFLPGRDGFSFGAAHASEIQYLFVLPRSTLAADSKALSDVMVKYWTNFAKLGDPNGTDLPAWPAYATTGTTMDSILSLTPGAGKVAVTTMFAVDHKCRP